MYKDTFFSIYLVKIPYIFNHQIERDCESIFYNCYLIILAHCLQGCQYGDCTAPNNCTCQSGWTGDSCNTGMMSFNYIDYNEHNAMQNTYHCGKATYKNHYNFLLCDIKIIQPCMLKRIA